VSVLAEADVRSRDPRLRITVLMLAVSAHEMLVLVGLIGHSTADVILSRSPSSLIAVTPSPM
jgi:hypothetical protein